MYGGYDYIGMLELFADRVKQLTEKVRAEWAKITVPREPITPDMCYPNDYDKSIVDEVVAIRKTVFRPEYQSADRQLVYVTGGNGAKGNPHGRACFCKNLYTGKESRFERYEVEGVVKPEHLPRMGKGTACSYPKADTSRKTSTAKGGTIMSRTNAGYTITDSIFIGKAEFVIGHNPSFPAPYVTWECKDGNNYFWGHYLSERKAAEKDLLDRAQTELRLQEQQKPPQTENKDKGKERDR